MELSGFLETAQPCKLFFSSFFANEISLSSKNPSITTFPKDYGILYNVMKFILPIIKFKNYLGTGIKYTYNLI